MNEKVAHLSEPFNPAVLRLIRHVAQEAHAAGRWVGMCGEMAGNPLAVPILLGLGIEEFSMSGGSIVPVRSLLHKLSYRDAQALASEALQLETAAQIKRHIEERLPFLADWMQSV
jgi:phosphotransferase system enzyme I (PtsI)